MVKVWVRSIVKNHNLHQGRTRARRGVGVWEGWEGLVMLRLRIKLGWGRPGLGSGDPVKNQQSYSASGGGPLLQSVALGLGRVGFGLRCPVDSGLS